MEVKKMEKNIEGAKCLLHRITMSKHISTDIWIPEEMNASDFKSLMDMSNKLIKIYSEGEVINIKDVKTEISDIKTENILDEEDKKIVELQKEGKTWRQIAVMLSKPVGTIYNYAKNKNLVVYRFNRGKRKDIKQIRKIVEEYSNCENTFERKELAKKYGYSGDKLSKNVSMWKKKLNLR
jgi:hypothetical protein